MSISINSDALYAELVTLMPLDDFSLPVGFPERQINGLALLKHYHTLIRRLRDLRLDLCHNPATKALILELGLLVDGLLGDGQVFKSFGYDTLYELKFLDYQLWKCFQQQKCDKDITALDDGFSIINDEEGSPMPGSESTPTTLNEERKMDGPSQSSIEFDVETDNDPEQLSLQAATDRPGSYSSEALHPVHDLYEHEESYLDDDSVTSKLFTAAKRGDETTLQLLLKHVSDVNSVKWSTSSFSEITLLSEAAGAGHEGIVQLLLDRGADPDLIYQWSSPLTEAARFGHEGIVQLLLDRGADPDLIYQWSSPLTEAARAGHKGIVQLLLDRGADPDVRCRWSSPLTEAARAGHKEVIQLLLDCGADVNAMTSKGLALSVAAASRKETSVRFLIRQGADVQLAALYLQTRYREEDMRWLLKITSSICNRQTADSDKSQNLRYLRLKFVNQYVLMAKAARDSPSKLRDLPGRFRNYGEAWTAGIGTLRGLCRGDAPRDVYGTVAFLSIARAIVETLHDKKNCNYIEEFERDLDRWEALFKDRADLEAYKDAMKSMWDVVFDEYSSNQREDVEALLRFQELASTLVSYANDVLDFNAFDDGGLEHSQQRWRERISKTHFTDIPNRFRDCQVLRVTRPPQQELIPPLPPDPSFCPSTSALGASIKADSSPFEPVAILLIAGAIFAIVIIFLRGTSQKCLAIRVVY